MEIVARAAYCEMNSIMHDHDKNWSRANKRIWRDTARAALTAIADAGYVIMPREVVDVLAWATPLAELATESHRLERVRCGHNDIRGTYKNGQTWVGIYQSEVDQIEQAREVCRAMRDAAMGGKG